MSQKQKMEPFHTPPPEVDRLGAVTFSVVALTSPPALLNQKKFPTPCTL